jgi:hypothetical protein
MRNIGTDQSKVFEQDLTSFNLLTRVDKHRADVTNAIISVYFHCAARNLLKTKDKMGKQKTEALWHLIK